MTDPITLPDIAAFLDVLADLNEETEVAGPVRLVELDAMLADAAAALTATRALVTTALLNACREPVRVGNEILHAEPDGKWRPDHATLHGLIVARSVHDDDGEAITDPERAADRATALAYAMFVSPSTMPKKAGLERIGRTAADVAEWEHVGWRLDRTPVKGAPE
jgi:hypothetical protein